MYKKPRPKPVPYEQGLHKLQYLHGDEIYQAPANNEYNNRSILHSRT